MTDKQKAIASLASIVDYHIRTTHTNKPEYMIQANTRTLILKATGISESEWERIMAEPFNPHDAPLVEG